MITEATLKGPPGVLGVRREGCTGGQTCGLPHDPAGSTGRPTLVQGSPASEQGGQVGSGLAPRGLG